MNKLKKTNNDMLRAMPAKAPLAMVRHEVHEPRAKAKAGRILTALRYWLARLVVLAATIALSVFGGFEMYSVLSTNQITALQYIFWVLFCINFSWISFAFVQATLGFLLNIMPWLPKPKEQDADFVTAILIPVYNEDPMRIRACLKVMREELLQDAPGKYAFFILSDTNRADNWIAEEQAFHTLIDHDKNGCPVYYRRRHQNTERKAGNIADWVTNYGADYEAMVVLDADSLMSAECLIHLSRRLAAAPGIGLIQTLPKIIHGESLYSRIQQFANHCYGPIYAKGLAFWHGRNSNFWGHNAIIRTRAFAESCGLPVLPGKAPFGGHVLSHDFMEAATLQRAGWGVRFDTDLRESFEEAPPSLLDVIIRDRRWCQGNLQHKAFVLARGFTLPTRIHLLSGIMSYLSAVFWFLLIVVGFAIALQAYFVRPEYFANPSLFPTWPVFDYQRARDLFIISMTLVLAPKLYGWFAAMVNLRRCIGFGGPVLLTLSTGAEILFSALYAPTLMLSQFLVVMDILRRRDSGWKAQSRDDGAQSLPVVARAHWGHTVFGGSLAAAAAYLSLELFYWSLPITLGLMLSIPLSWLSGGVRRGKLLKILGILRAPEEKRTCAIVAASRKQYERERGTESRDALSRLMDDDMLYNWHVAQIDLNPNYNKLCRNRVYGAWLIENTESLKSLITELTEAETLAILQNHQLLAEMRKYLAGQESLS